jgi:branched-chain amino acid aminotransferase
MAKYKNLSFFEGKIVPAEKALVSIQTHALQYGTSIFGGIRGYYNSEKKNLFIFRLKDHVKRLMNSVKLMQLQLNITEKKLHDNIFDLVSACGYTENIYIRPFIYTSALQLSPRFHDVKAELAIYILQLNDYLDTKKGLKTMVSSWRRIEDNMIPTMSKASGGYVNSALAKSEAVQNGLDEAIFLDSRGMVSEGSAENIFFVRDGKIITPSLTSSILEGITRKSVIQLARDEGYEVTERDVTRSEMYICDELFFSGTGVQVAWVKEVDKRVIGDGKIGKITQHLQNKFFEIVKGNNEKYSDWTTKVY